MPSRSTNLVTSCINGDLRVGDMVISTDNHHDYAYLVGSITEITKIGSPHEHPGSADYCSTSYGTTANDTVCIDFSQGNYSEGRIAEIEAKYSRLWNEEFELQSDSFAFIQLYASELINISELPDAEFDALLDSEEAAAEFCNWVIANNNFSKENTVIAIEGKVAEECLYSPLRFYLHNPREEERSGESEMYDLFDNRYEISDIEASYHMDAIELAIRRGRDKMDKVHGLAEFLPDELKEKVWSILPAIELTNGLDQNGRIIGSIHCIAKLEFVADLTAQEMVELKNWWQGQLSDGWGEGFQYREINIGSEELYVVPWSYDIDFYIDTQAEFDTRMGTDRVKEWVHQRSTQPESTSHDTIKVATSDSEKASQKNLEDNVNSRTTDKSSSFTSVMEHIHRDKEEKRSNPTNQKNSDYLKHKRGGDAL